MSLFIKIIASEKLFPSLTDELTESKSSNHNMTTRANTFNALPCDSCPYLQGFLVRTSREIHTGDIVADQ